MDKPCVCCPMIKRYKIKKLMGLEGHIKGHDREVSCVICRKTVGINYDCPCFVLGENTALKRAHIAVDEYFGNKI